MAAAADDSFDEQVPVKHMWADYLTETTGPEPRPSLTFLMRDNQFT